MLNIHAIFRVVLALTTIASFTGCAPMVTQQQQAALKEVEEYCRQVYQDDRLSLIKDKVPISMRITEALPMIMMANDQRPTESEKASILVWADLRQDCQQHARAKLGAAPAHLEAIRNANSQAMADLYGGRVTYGEFAKQLNQNRMAFLQQDQSLRDQANRDALQQQQAIQQMLYQQQQLNLQQQQINNQNRPTNCTTRYIGNQAYTNCN